MSTDKLVFFVIKNNEHRICRRQFFLPNIFYYLHAERKIYKCRGHIFFVQDILKQAMEDRLSSAADLPYFEGDFWPNVLEESIKELDQEEEEKRKQAEAAEAAAANAVSCER